MGEKKVTKMVLKVDLQCEKCYRKVKKVLCKFPQIRDQMYDEKNNLVIIKVVCCSPEKIRDKICCKGGGAIISIDIKLYPDKPQPPPDDQKPRPPPDDQKPQPPPDDQKPRPPPDDQKPRPPPDDKKPRPPPDDKKPRPPPDDKKPRPPPDDKKPRPPPCDPCPGYPPRRINTCCTECYGGHPGGPCETGYGYGGPPQAAKPKSPPAEKPPLPPCPRDTPRRVNTCCTECYGGHPGGPCETGYGYGGPPQAAKPKSPPAEKPPLPPCPRDPPRRVNTCCTECYGGHPGGPCETGYGYGGPPRAAKPKSPPAEKPPLPPCPRDPPRRVNTCCTECYGGHPGGPCKTGYGYGGPAPYIQYDGYCGRPVYDSYGGGRNYTTSYCVTRPDCFREENPQACAIM